MKVFTWTKYQQKYFSISALASKISQLKKIMADYHVNLSSNIIICFLIRAEIQKYFHWFLVQMKTSKSAFEINWPLGALQTLSHSSSVLIMEAMAPWSKPNNPRSKNGDYYFCLGVSQCLQANYQLVVGLGCLAFTSCPPFCVPIRDFVWPKVDEY